MSLSLGTIIYFPGIGAGIAHLYYSYICYKLKKGENNDSPTSLWCSSCLHCINITCLLFSGSCCLCAAASSRPSLLIACYTQTYFYKIITETQHVASRFKTSLIFLGSIFWILYFWYLTDLFFPSPPPPSVFLFNPAFPCNTPLHFSPQVPAQMESFICSQLPGFAVQGF